MDKDAEGYILISRMAYSPEEQVLSSDARQVMADAMIASQEKIDARRQWTAALKKNCGSWNRFRAIEEILKTSNTKGMPYQTIGDLQNAWATKDKKQLVKVGADIVKLLSTGYFQIKGRGEHGSWKYNSEKEYMEVMKIRYKDGYDSRRHDGCLAALLDENGNNPTLFAGWTDF